MQQSRSLTRAVGGRMEKVAVRKRYEGGERGFVGLDIGGRETGIGGKDGSKQRDCSQHSC